MDSSMRKFQSPPSVRKATALAIINAQKIDKFQSPPSVRKATCITNLICNQIVISIPAFREEGDWNLCHFKHTFNISIPAFREEGDGVKLSYSISAMGFQSPPSVRKATVTTWRRLQAILFQSPPSVRKATEFYHNQADRL